MKVKYYESCNAELSGSWRDSIPVSDNDTLLGNSRSVKAQQLSDSDFSFLLKSSNACRVSNGRTDIDPDEVQVYMHYLINKLKEDNGKSCLKVTQYSRLDYYKDVGDNSNQPNQIGTPSQEFKIFKQVSYKTMQSESRKDWANREIRNLTHPYFEQKTARFFTVVIERDHRGGTKLMKALSENKLYIRNAKDLEIFQKEWSHNEGPLFIFLKHKPYDLKERWPVGGVLQIISKIKKLPEDRWLGDIGCRVKFVSTALMESNAFSLLLQSNNTREIGFDNVQRYRHHLISKLQENDDENCQNLFKLPEYTCSTYHNDISDHSNQTSNKVGEKDQNSRSDYPPAGESDFSLEGSKDFSKNGFIFNDGIQHHLLEDDSLCEVNVGLPRNKSLTNGYKPCNGHCCITNSLHEEHRIFEEVSYDKMQSESWNDWATREICNLRHTHFEHKNARFFSFKMKCDKRGRNATKLMKALLHNTLYIKKQRQLEILEEWDPNKGPLFVFLVHQQYDVKHSWHNGGILQVITQHKSLPGYKRRCCEVKFVSTATLCDDISSCLENSNSRTEIDPEDSQRYIHHLINKLQEDESNNYVNLFKVPQYSCLYYYTDDDLNGEI